MRRNKNKRPNKLCMKCFPGGDPRTGRCHITYIHTVYILESFEICTNENCGSKLNYPKQQQQQQLLLPQWKQNNKSGGKGINVERPKPASCFPSHCNPHFFHSSPTNSFLKQITCPIVVSLRKSNNEVDENQQKDLVVFSDLKIPCYFVLCIMT